MLKCERIATSKLQNG